MAENKNNKLRCTKVHCTENELLTGWPIMLQNPRCWPDRIILQSERKIHQASSLNPMVCSPAQGQFAPVRRFRLSWAWCHVELPMKPPFLQGPTLGQLCCKHTSDRDERFQHLVHNWVLGKLDFDLALKLHVLWECTFVQLRSYLLDVSCCAGRLGKGLVVCRLDLSAKVPRVKNTFQLLVNMWCAFSQPSLVPLLTRLLSFRRIHRPSTLVPSNGNTTILVGLPGGAIVTSIWINGMNPDLWFWYLSCIHYFATHNHGTLL